MWKRVSVRTSWAVNQRQPRAECTEAQGGLRLAPGPGWGHPEETLNSSLNTVLWKAAESGPRPPREPHPTKGAPPQGLGRDSLFLSRWALSGGVRLWLGMESKVSADGERGGGGARLLCCGGLGRLLQPLQSWAAALRNTV